MGRGLKSRAGIAVITAALAILMQIGYYGVIHPEWPVFMVDQTRQYFTDQGASPEEIETRVAAARTSFTLPRYAASSAMAALVAGLVFPMVFTWVGLWRYRRRLAG